MSPRLTTAVATAAAVLLLAGGGCLLFFPEEIGRALLGAEAGASLPLAVLGGALIGLGEINWMTRQNLMGGIYGRPVVAANLAHFTIGGITLLKHGGEAWGFWAVTAVYLLGAVAYGYLLFASPKAA